MELLSSRFSEAVDKYVDNNKPVDPLCLQQMKAWLFEWRNGANGDDYSSNHTDSEDTSWSELTQNFPKGQDHVIAGKLSWKGPYIIVHLKTSCQWRNSTSSNSNNKKYGCLLFRCQAWGEVVPLTGEMDKIEKQVRTKMIQRLTEDSYLQKIVGGFSAVDGKIQQKQQSLLEVCNASIVVREPSPTGSSDVDGGSGLEERVHWDETVLESIRRAVFSQAESTLDVLDLILSFPFLPTVASSAFSVGTNNNESQTSETTHLADRAKLRFLEDAMYNACEQEEEEEIVQDLHISKKLKEN